MQSTTPPAEEFASAHPATALLRDLLDVTEDFERALGAELGVNTTDLHAMEHLISAGPLAASDLSRRLGVSNAATTTVIDRLTALGHVHREPNPDDRRGVLVVASPASQARAMARIVPMVLGIDEAIHGFDADEQAAITRYLEQVVDVYRAHAAGGALTNVDQATDPGTDSVAKSDENDPSTDAAVGGST